MKKLTAMVLSIVATLTIAGQASAYTVKSGDTMGGIAKQHGLTLTQIVELNPQVSNPNMIYIGQEISTVVESKVNTPYEISQADKELMARLVRAEAVGEPYAGKVAVATVVLNRLKHPDFPNTIQGVIYETYSNGKYYAFTPVQNGEINKPYGAEEMKAVEEAINFAPYSSGSIFFYNPKTATSEWIRTREVTVTIGNHVFAK